MSADALQQRAAGGERDRALEPGHRPDLLPRTAVVRVADGDQQAVAAVGHRQRLDLQRLLAREQLGGVVVDGAGREREELHPEPGRQRAHEVLLDREAELHDGLGEAAGLLGVAVDGRDLLRGQDALLDEDVGETCHVGAPGGVVVRDGWAG